MNPVFRFIRTFKERFLKFHNKNGTINWSALFWYCYLLGTPFWLIGIFVDDPYGIGIDPFSATWYFLLVFAWMFLIIDIVSSRRKYKNWDRVWKEEMSIMSRGGWSQDPEKVKRLEELRDERERFE